MEPLNDFIVVSVREIVNDHFYCANLKARTVPGLLNTAPAEHTTR